jgi:hypothetical protein
MRLANQGLSFKIIDVPQHVPKYERHHQAIVPLEYNPLF